MGATVDGVMARVRGEAMPYCARVEAALLRAPLDAAVAAGEGWGLWLRGRLADAHLLADDEVDADALWSAGAAGGHPGCMYECARRAERAMRLDEAAGLYTRAADAGFAPAAWGLGLVRMKQRDADAWRLSATERADLQRAACAACERAIALGLGAVWEDLSFVMRSDIHATEADAEAARQYLARADAVPVDARRARVLESLRGWEHPMLSERDMASVKPWLKAATDDGWALWLRAGCIDAGLLPGKRAQVEVLWQEGAALGEPLCKSELAQATAKRSKKAAQTLWEEAAAGGVAEAAVRLGNTARTWSEARGWYVRAAALGRIDAWIEVARGHITGARGAPVDPLEAMRCWERAAETGAAGPASTMAEAYEAGRFDATPIPRDPAKARHYAAFGMNLELGNGGDAACQLVMAKLYAAGEGGLPRDPEAAALWSRIAARDGERVEPEARALYKKLWAKLDATARARVDARDRALRPFEYAA